MCPVSGSEVEPAIGGVRREFVGDTSRILRPGTRDSHLLVGRVKNDGPARVGSVRSERLRGGDGEPPASSAQGISCAARTRDRCAPRLLLEEITDLLAQPLPEGGIRRNRPRSCGHELVEEPGVMESREARVLASPRADGCAEPPSRRLGRGRYTRSLTGRVFRHSPPGTKCRPPSAHAARNSQRLERAAVHDPWVCRAVAGSDATSRLPTQRDGRVLRGDAR
jgi:hypothetical protein